MISTLNRALALAIVATPCVSGVAQAPSAPSPTQAPASVPGATPKSSSPAAKTGQSVPAKPGTLVAKPGRTPVRVKAAKPKAPPKPVWQEFKLDPKATLFLDFTESSADAVFSILSRTSGITILRDPSFKSPLTVTSAKAVDLNEAFEILNTVLGLQGYQFQKRGNLLLVARIPQPQPSYSAPPPQPVPVIKTYPLQNANAAQVARVLTDIFAPAGGGAGNPGGGMAFPGRVVFGGEAMPTMGGGGGGRPNALKATSEDYTNSVIVNALPEDQTKAEALIKELDKRTSQPLESEVFTFKYVPVDQAMSAIDDLLTANSPTGRGAKKASDNNPNQGFYSYYSPYGAPPSQKTAGGQSVTAIKQTNSVAVNATKENMDLIRKLVENLDQPGAFTGTTFVVRLDNAKASDVADLLNKLFTQKTNPNDNGFFYFSDFYGGGGSNSQKSAYSTDIDENGRVVNVRDIVGKVNIVADPNTNSLVIQTQPGNMKMIRPIVERLDSTVQQVMIETVIVEANLDQTDKLGVEYGTLGSILNGGDTGSGSIDFGLGKATDLQGLKYTIGNPDYKIFLSAVSSDSRFKVLDTPRIFTSNNIKAEIKVGQKLPYITNQTVNALGNVISTYNFEDVSVTLTVTPRITANGQVTMEVVQAADDLQGFTSYNAPIINNRQASTTVSVNDGATIVLGGIIRHTTNDSKTKVPILGDLPFLGSLFRSTVKQKGQTELMVFLTPHVVRSNADAQRLRDEETGRLSRPSQDDLKRIVPPVKAPSSPR